MIKEEEKKFGSRRQNISLKNLYLDTNNYRFIDSKDYISHVARRGL